MVKMKSKSQYTYNPKKTTPKKKKKSTPKKEPWEMTSKEYYGDTTRTDQFWNEGEIFHGTVIDNLKDIKEYGLIPSSGSFVEMWYWEEREYMEQRGEDPPEFVFMCGKDELVGCISALYHHVGEKLGKDMHDVTWEDIKKYGLLIMVDIEDNTSIWWVREERSGYEFVDLSGEVQGGDWDLPHGVEGSEYFSESSEYMKDYLSGEDLVKFVKKYHEKEHLRLIEKALRQGKDVPQKILKEYELI
jgi:hypothetical protein